MSDDRIVTEGGGVVRDDDDSIADERAAAAHAIAHAPVELDAEPVDQYTIVGHCPDCGASRKAPTYWQGDTPRLIFHTCQHAGIWVELEGVEGPRRVLVPSRDVALPDANMEPVTVDYRDLNPEQRQSSLEELQRDHQAEPSAEEILPSPLNPSVAPIVAQAVCQAFFGDEGSEKDG